MTRSPVHGLAAALTLMALAAGLASCQQTEEDTSQLATEGSTARATASASPSSSAPATLAPSPSASPDVPPASTTRYTNPVFGYTLEYPEGWFVRTDPGGYTIITSYDPAEASGIGGIRQEAVKIDILVVDKAPGQTLDQWIAESDLQRQSTDPVTKVSEASLTSPAPGIRRDTIVQEVPVQEYYFDVGAQVFSLSAFPATSPLIGAIDPIVESLDFPQ